MWIDCQSAIGAAQHLKQHWQVWWLWQEGCDGFVAQRCMFEACGWSRNWAEVLIAIVVNNSCIVCVDPCITIQCLGLPARSAHSLSAPRQMQTNSSNSSKQEDKVIWQRLHWKTSAQWSRVEPHDRQTPHTSVTMVCISCIWCLSDYM